MRKLRHEVHSRRIIAGGVIAAFLLAGVGAVKAHAAPSQVPTIKTYGHIASIKVNASKQLRLCLRIDSDAPRCIPRAGALTETIEINRKAAAVELTVWLRDPALAERDRDGAKRAVKLDPLPAIGSAAPAVRFTGLAWNYGSLWSRFEWLSPKSHGSREVVYRDSDTGSVTVKLAANVPGYASLFALWGTACDVRFRYTVKYKAVRSPWSEPLKPCPDSVKPSDYYNAIVGIEPATVIVVEIPAAGQPAVRPQPAAELCEGAKATSSECLDAWREWRSGGYRQPVGDVAPALLIW